MMLEEIIAILEREAEKCQSFADECKRKGGKDEDFTFYWVGKRRGILDSVKYIKRLEEGDE